MDGDETTGQQIGADGSRDLDVITFSGLIFCFVFCVSSCQQYTPLYPVGASIEWYNTFT